MRGQAQSLGGHTFRIGDDGVDIFPRAVLKPARRQVRIVPNERLSLGVPALDQMMGGGLPAACSLLVAGPSGSGKTGLAAQFLAEGVRVANRA